MKLLFVTIIFALLDLGKNIFILMKGQDSRYRILQMSHRIEKGLAMNQGAQRDGWGFDKANLLLKEINKSNDYFVNEIALSVLNAFDEQKAKSSKAIDKQRYIDFSAKLKKCIERGGRSENTDLRIAPGGAVAVSSTEILLNKDFKSVLLNRHSCRDFDINKKVDIADLKSAIELANHCPSACNRQPYHIYVINNCDYELDKEMGSEYTLIVTGIVNAFTISEYLDWIVSASIFSGYLCSCLHYYGIGSLLMHYGLLVSSSSKNICKICGIPKNEKIILRIRVGSYKNNFKVAHSQRLNIEDLITFV